MSTRLTHAVETVAAGVQDLPGRLQPLLVERKWLVGGAVAVGALVLLGYVVLLPSPTKKTVHAVPVTIAQATVKDLPLSTTAIGAAQAWTSVSILAQVSGKLLRVEFKEGSYVKAGQVLAQIDPAPYRAALTQAEGALERDRALLADAKLDLARYDALVKASAVSRQQYDTQAALVKQDEGTVLLDEGAVAAAKVNLGWCTITSPITGRVGVRLVDPGNLVSASGSISSMPATAAATSAASPTSSSNSGIVIVNQIEPMAVTFTIPEGQFQRLSELSNDFHKPMVVKAFSQESGDLLDTGELSIADNRVDPTTGTVELKARFPNAQHRLWPGQFVNVQLMLQVIPHATTVPVAAVNQGPNGPFLFVVGADKKVSMRPVVVAWTEGDTAAIKSGVKPGETVVTDGQMILKNGATVRIVPQAPVRKQNA